MHARTRARNLKDVSATPDRTNPSGIGHQAPLIIPPGPPRNLRFRTVYGGKPQDNDKAPIACSSVGMVTVCGCLLRTQQCVELYCSDWWCCASLMFCSGFMDPVCEVGVC